MNETIVEVAARVIYDFDSYPMPWSDEIEEKRRDYRELAATVLAAIAPLIEAVTLERAARAIDRDGWYTSEEIAAAIRGLKEQP